jgi:hypothetical protein
MYGANFRPEDEVEVERREQEQFRLRHQNQDRKLLGLRNRRVFRHELQKYIV